MPAHSHSRMKLVVAVLVAIVISVWLSTHGGLAFTSSLRAWVRPLAGVLSSWAQGLLERRAEREALISEREMLYGEVARLTAAIRDLAVCQEENSELKTLVRYLPDPGFVTVSARILAPVNVVKTQILIDQGAAHGITQGSAAVSGEGILWGRVTKVEREFSVVSLLSDAALAVPARVAGSEPVGILRRDEQGSLILDLLPLTLSIDQDAVVLTAGLDERIPPNLMIGRVINAERRARMPFLHIEVSPAPVVPRAFLYVVVRGSAGQ